MDQADAYRRTLERAKNESALQLLFQAARRLNELALVRVAAQPGRPELRPAHTNLFPHIALEGTRITELAQKLGITKQAVSQLVEDLERLGVVERAPDPDDARAKLVRFTKRGRKGLLDGLAILSALEADLARRLKPGTMKVLKEALHDILAEVSAMEAEPAER